MKGVREVFGEFMCEHDAQDKAQSDVAAELCKMLKLRYKQDAPRRAPKIILVGPPGSGCQTQSKALAQYFGLVRISVREMLKKEIQANPS